MMESRLPPPRGAPNYMSRIYRSDLRPAVLFGAFFALVWSLVTGISSLRNVPYFNRNLGIFYIVLGCIGMAIVAIEAFGLFAVGTRGPAAVRTYAYLSIVATLAIAAIYIIQTFIHYHFKIDIINLCTNVNAGDRIFYTGFFGPVEGGIVTPLEALAWCSQEYDRDSFSNIVALLVVTGIAALFALLVFAYLRQLRDPTSPANVIRERVFMSTLGPYDNQPYNSDPNQRYNPYPNQPHNPYPNQPHNPYPNQPHNPYPNDPPPTSDYDKFDSTPPAYRSSKGENFVDNDKKDGDPQWNGS